MSAAKTMFDAHISIEPHIRFNAAYNTPHKYLESRLSRLPAQTRALLYYTANYRGPCLCPFGI